MKYLLVISLSLLSTIAYSQDYFTAGAIVTSTNDTIHGLIDDKQWHYNPVSIKFKKSANDAEKVYSTADLKSFTTQSNTYESHSFKYDGDMLGNKYSSASAVTANFPTSRLPVKWIDKTAFLVLHARGKYSLYSFRDEDERLHFFINSIENQDLVELQFRQYVVYKNNVSLISVSNYFQQQLINYGGACEETKKFTKLKYMTDALIDAVNKINMCNGSFVEDSKEKIPLKHPLFGISVDVFFPKVRNEVFESDFSKPFVGFALSAEFFSKTRPNRLSYYLELKLRNVSVDGKIPFYYAPGADTKIKYTSLNLLFMGRVNLQKNPTVYFNGGVLSGVRSATKYTPIVQQSKLLYQDGDPEVGFCLGVGKRFPLVKANVEVRFEFSAPIGVSIMKNIQTVGVLFTKQFQLSEK